MIYERENMKGMFVREKKVWEDQTSKRVWNRKGLWGSNNNHRFGMRKKRVCERVCEDWTSNKGHIWKRACEREDLWKKGSKDHTTRKSQESQHNHKSWKSQE